jgi:hypothetical protein
MGGCWTHGSCCHVAVSGAGIGFVLLITIGQMRWPWPLGR